MAQYNPHLETPSEITPVETFAALSEGSDVNYVHIDAVPRSMSTILPIVLCEAGVVDSTRDYIQCDEPLNWQTRGIGWPAVALALLALRGETQRPTTIFEKSTARNVYPSTFGEISDVAEGVVFTIRHPEKQMYSLCQRIANDLAHGRGTQDKMILADLDSEEYRAALQAVDAFLAVSGHHDGIWPAGEQPYMQPSWREIGNNFRHAMSANIPMAVIDGTRLTEQPERTLRKLCQVLALPYSSTMVDGWSALGGSFNKDHTDWASTKTDKGGFTNGWIARATHTTGIQEDITPRLDIGNCPSRMQAYIEQVAIPTYEEMISHSSNSAQLT